MSTRLPKAGRPAFHSLSEVAWILGVPSSAVSRAVRAGLLPVARRRHGLAVAARDLARLLDRRRSGEPAEEYGDRQ